MSIRLILILWFTVIYTPAVYAAQCLDIFPSATNENVAAQGLGFINVPIFSPVDGFLINPQSLSLGDSQHQINAQEQEIFVTSTPITETSARLYLSGSVAWSNAKINVGGNPEDLIIIVSGSLDITGGNTEINAIIYAYGDVSVTGNVEINGAIASEVGLSTNPAVNINYDQSAIDSADFNGMCGNTGAPTPPLSCDVLFPGSGPLASFGNIGTIEIKGSVQCNPGNCSIENVTQERLPTIPAGGSNLGEFNRGSLSDEEYNLYSSWKSSRTSVTFDDSSGTAVIYIESNGNDIMLPENTRLNVTGNATNTPAEVLLVIKTDKKVEIGKNSILNAFIYIVADEEVKINEDVTINGAFTVITDKLTVEERVELTYNLGDLDDFNPHGYCDPVPAAPVIPIANYQFDECAYTGATSEVLDQIGSYHATAFSSVNTSENGQIERFIDISNASHHIETSIPLPTDFTVSTWFKKPTSITGNRYFILGAMQSGGDLLYIDRNNSWRWGVWDGGSASNGQFSFSNLDDNWHHLTLVYSAGNTQLYIDGVLEDTINRAPSGTLKYIGTSLDEINGSNPQGFRSPLDEFLVYDVALDASEVLTIYDNQLAANDYDGSTRASVSCSGLLAFYQFEQTDISVQINDTSGLDNHADVPFIGASMADGKYCRGFDSVSYNRFDYTGTAFRSELDLDEGVGLRGTISFWFNSTINWNTDFERVLFDASSGSNATDKYFVFEIQQDGRLKFAFEDSVDADFSLIESSTNNRQADTWYYLTVTWDYLANDFAIYVDGALQIQQTKNTNGAMGELDQIVFGDNSSDYTQTGNSPVASPYSSRGNYDEVRIYKKVLTQSEIQIDMNDNNGCSVIDHFEINSQNGQGLTCEADLITIKACADASCNTLNTDAIDVVLSVTDPVNNIVLTKNVIVVGGEIDVNYVHTKVEVVSLSLDQTYECINGYPTDCDVTFLDAGFVFSTIDDQVAGVDFSGINIQAVKDINGVCTDLLSGSKTVDMAMEYIAPSRSTANKYFISGTEIDKNLAGTVNDYTPISLNFVANSIADLGTNKYNDAGQVKLYARYVEPASGGNPSFTIEGSSNDFWVSPHHFSVVAENGSIILDNTTTTSPTTKKQVAGDDFTISFTAENADNNATTNYIAQQAQLQLERTGPTSGGAEGTLKYSNSESISSQLNDGSLGYSDAAEVVFDLNGKYEFNTATYSEVGLTKLYIRDNNYGSGVYKAESSADVGRFIPAYFTQTVGVHGELSAYHYSTCDLITYPETDDWAYAGQTRDNSGNTVGAISYADFLSPTIHITAFNRSGNITKNYTEDGYMKLTSSGITIPAPTADNSMPRLFPTVPLEKVQLSANMSAGDEPDAIGTNDFVSYTFNQQDHFIYEHNKHSKLQPFSVNIPFLVTSVEDGDEVKLYSGSDTNIIATEKVITTGVEVHFGRWLLENSYGPETSNLPVTMFIQHFDGTNFITNDEENCLVPSVGVKDLTGNIGDGGMPLWNYRLADLDGFDNLVPTDTDASFADLNKSFVSGLYQWLLFSAPGAGKIGSLEVEYQVPPWLQYDWNNDSDFDNNPTAKLTFGLFRGNDRIIYQREIDK
ncbi:LamG domain-containing protein [Colwellia psychrerythraea]|uniref:LamG-like jellyroll fold domain-containing protein n=1 Tax=Colwellia psychrerythraea TaxID=28229 RepID=A0A099KR18_COLPS|nr:LamG domain-containing protein [Colwellia psychrerythraea]KGJ92357.1 Protein of unknown function DUF2572 [Colwellia psychrerythraea]